MASTHADERHATSTRSTTLELSATSTTTSSRSGCPCGGGLRGKRGRRVTPAAGSERITTCLSALLARTAVKHQAGPKWSGSTGVRTMPVRGQIAGPAVVTVQPASIVRLDGAEARRGVFAGFVDDLRGR